MILEKAPINAYASAIPTVSFLRRQNLIHTLMEDGGCFVTEAPQEERILVDFFEEHFDLLPEERSEKVTKIHNTQSKTGLGYTQGALYPHTDRSGLSTPPDVLLFICRTTADYGGDSVLVDGDAVIAQLVKSKPEAIKILTQSKCVFKRREEICECCILEFGINGELNWRFRYDSFGYFPREVIDILPYLHQAFHEVAVHRKLKVGEGYLINNRRMLHGRASYIGAAREGWRMLGKMRANNDR